MKIYYSLTKWNWNKTNKISVNCCANKNVLLFQFCFSVCTCETSCFIYCIELGIVSRDSIVDDDWLPVTDWCRVMKYYTIVTDVAKNCGWVSCMECTALGKDFELILTVKMKTRHPVDGQFGREFLAICNHCGVMAAWSRKTWKFCEHFLRFLKNDPSR